MDRFKYSVLARHWELIVVANLGFRVFNLDIDHSVRLV